METRTLPENPPPPPPAVDFSSKVDTSRAFRSVKEAVAIFGERFLTGQILLPSSKPPFILPKQETPSWKSTNSSQSSWKSCSSSCDQEEPPPPSPSSFLVTSLQKLESELEETKKELKLLKERESETKVALASLNAELQKKMLKNVNMAEVAEKAVVSGGGERKTKTVKKKKPIILLVGDLFSKKKGKSNASFFNPLYSSSQVHLI